MSAPLVLEITGYAFAAAAYLYFLLRPEGAYEQGPAAIAAWTAAMLAFALYPSLLSHWAARRPGLYAAGYLAIATIITWLTRQDFISGLLMYVVVVRGVLLGPRIGAITGSAAVAGAYLIAGLLFGWRSSEVFLVLLAWAAGLVFVGVAAHLLVRERAARERSDALLRELESAHAQLGEYAAQVRDLATTQERNRLAREIHDSLGHYLTVVNVQLEAALALRERDAARADRAVAEAKRLASEALAEVRRSVAALRPAALDSLPLADALRRQVTEARAVGDLDITLEIEGDLARCDAAVGLALYRAVQEALTNVRRHADATRAQIVVAVSEQAVELRVEDDGRGPQAPEAIGAPTNGGSGLAGLRDRAAALGGSVYFGPPSSHPTNGSAGAELRVTLPVQVSA
jgi:signal transduction histidine kinase